MKQANHRTYGSWIFGTALLLFMFSVFWFTPSNLPFFKQQVLAFSMALLAGLFGFFLTGDVTLAIQHKKSSTSLKAVGGIALFILVLVWWNSSASPVIAVQAQQNTTSSSIPAQTPKLIESGWDSGIHSVKDAKIHAEDSGKVNVITGNGQAVQGKQTSGELKEQPATPTNSSISSNGNLVIEAKSKGKVNVITGNGQIQQAE